MSTSKHRRLLGVLTFILFASFFNMAFMKKVHAAPTLATFSAAPGTKEYDTDEAWKNRALNCSANTTHAMYFNRATQSGTKVTFYIHGFSYRCGNASSSAPSVYNELLSIAENPNTSAIDVSPVMNYAPKFFYSNITLAPGKYTPVYAYGPFTLDLKTAGSHTFNISYKVGSFGNSTNTGISGINLIVNDLCSNLAGVQYPVPSGYTVIGGQCGRPPAGNISASCTSNKVTVTYTTSDLDGGNLTVSLTSTPLWSGAKTDTRAPVTNYTLLGSPFNFTGTINTPYSITGTVTDSIGLRSNLTAGSYTCVVPTAVVCSFISPPPGYYEPGDSVTPKMKIDRNADLGATSLSVTQTAKINTTSYPSSAVTISNSVSTQTITYPTIVLPEPSTASTSLYTLTGSISWTGGSATCPDLTFNVARKPFFTVNKGDLIVGGSYTSCDIGASLGNLSSWSLPSTSMGASASYVAQVIGAVSNYYSAKSFSSRGSDSKHLTLANNSTSTYPWGGNYNSAACFKDIYTTTKNDVVAAGVLGETITVQNLDSRVGDASQVEYLNGNITISGSGGTSVLPPGSFTGKLAVYVTGDVYISGDIRLSQYYGTNASTDGIPFFALIVKGNIFVAQGVKFLDGMYIAQPKDNGTGGAIHTCASAMSVPVASTSVYSSCQTQLEFNGIVQAKEMKLHRVNGTLNTNIPAEIFNGLPELYLANTPFRGTTATSKYDSAANLPPSL